MLIDFTVENFRSIKEPVTLSAVAQKSKIVPSGDESTRHIKSDNEIAPAFPVEGWGFELLPVLAVFGANASGKSNIIHALDFLLGYMRSGASDSPPIWHRVVPFEFDGRHPALATRFELRVALDSSVYTYSLHINRERIVFERLDYAVAVTKVDRLLFKRSWNQDKQCDEWQNGKWFGGPHKQLERSVSQRDPFISLLMRLEVDVIKPLKRWLLFRPLGIGIGYESMDHRDAVTIAQSVPAHLQELSAFIRMFDTGIHNLEVVKTKTEADKSSQYEVIAWHNTGEGNYWLPLHAESTGTQRLFRLASRVFQCCKFSTLMLEDELEASIHPNIVREIVQIFQNPKTNPERAQMIFTSHDATLQRGQLLRRDQIWFTQKRGDGGTNLYPLSDFKPRNDTAIDKSYLDGRYGAVPVLPDEDELAAITTGKRHAA